MNPAALSRMPRLSLDLVVSESTGAGSGDVILDISPGKPLTIDSEAGAEEEGSSAPQKTVDAGLQETIVDREILGTFLNDHCVRCHGPEKQKAKLRLDEFDFAISDKDEALYYQDVLDVLNSAEMPPEDEPQPDRDISEQVIGELTRGLFEAGQRLASKGGRVEMRRLNRREYAATIDQLFGFIPKASAIPPDVDVENFDTVGSRQHFTTDHVDHYYELGREILELAFRLAGTRDPLTNGRGRIQRRFGMPTSARPLSNGAERRERWRESPGRGRPISTGPWSRAGSTSTMRWGISALGSGVDPRATYRIRVTAGAEGEISPLRRFIRVGNKDGIWAVFRIDGTTENPSQSEVEIRPVALGDGKISGKVSEDRSSSLSHYLWTLKTHEGLVDYKSEGIIWIDAFEIEGPHYPDGQSFFESLFLPDGDSGDSRPEMAWDDDDAEDLIARFTAEAFRHRITVPEFVSGLVAHFKAARERGAEFETAMVDTLAIVLASPGFLFLNEGLATEGEPRDLSSRDRAYPARLFSDQRPPRCGPPGSGGVGRPRAC